MSVVHQLLSRVEEKENLYVNMSAPTGKSATHNRGLFVFDLPGEILNDFYGMKEYIRIANKSGNIRVLSITSSMNGEGSSTIATYLSFLMAGGMGKKADPRTLVPEPDSLFTEDLRAIVKNNHAPNVVPMNTLAGQTDTTVSNPVNPGRNDFLLVDPNFNQPTLHRYFGIESNQGLGEVIEQNTDWRNCLIPVQGSALKIITAGKSDSKPVELLSSERFRTLVRQWRNQFKYVIIDTPPVLTSVESLSVASVTDGVVLIVCAGQTRWDSAQNAKRKLQASGINLLGVALNRRKMDIPDGLYRRLVA